MEKTAIIIYGPPGSGKGTQAELLARGHNFIHFDTGRYIEALVHDPRLKKDPVVRREGKLFDTGILCTPSWVLKIVREAARRIARAGFGMVFSGSPRTLFEAFGDKKNRGLLTELKRLYGQKNIRIIALEIPEKFSIVRNGARLVCSVCGLPVMKIHKNEVCSFCGGSFRRRTLDKPSVIKVRLNQYRERTYPIIARAKKSGFTVLGINGKPVPHKIFRRVVKTLDLA